jgi:hypothetical protein
MLLFYIFFSLGFIHVTGHANNIITQVEEYMPDEKVTKVFVPEHNENSELTSYIFHNQDYKIDVIDDTCQIGPGAEMEVLTDHSSYTVSMSDSIVDSNERQLSLVPSEVTLENLPKIVHTDCLGKSLIEIEAIVNKSDLTFDEYQNSRVVNGLRKRRRRATDVTLQCENQCTLNKIMMDAMNSLSDGPTKTKMQQTTINNSFGFACTHHEYGTCNGRSCMYKMSVLVHDGDAAVVDKRVFRGYTIKMHHVRNLGGFCLPCCKYETHPDKKHQRYRVLQCVELHKGSKEICDAYKLRGRCGLPP